MQHAVNLARTGLGRTGVNPSVGCVLVKNGHVIAAARTADGGRPHAEFIALEKAGSEAKGATAYVTLEPCAHEGETPSCARLLEEAGVKRVVVGCADPDPRTKDQNSARYEFLESDEASAVHAGFLNRMTLKRPFVTLKLGISQDKKIAAGKGKRTQISGALAQRYMHMERSQHDAVLVGIETVLSDAPLLTARLDGVEHSITRVVLDTNLRMSAESQLVQSASEYPLYILHNAKAEGGDALQKSGAELIAVDTRDITAVLKALAEKRISRLLVEGGAKVHTSFLKADVCDQFLVCSSKEMVIGVKGVDALDGYDIDALETDFGLKKKRKRDLGADILEVYERCLQD